MKLTVVTVCKNDVLGLEKTYNSILSQTSSDYEWIIVDGKSSDSTIDFLKNINVDNVKWISEPDESLYDAMNKGINLSSGEFIVFLNSADVFADKDVVGDILEVIQNEKKDIKLLYGSSLDITKDGKEFFRKSKRASSYWTSMIAQHQAVIFNTKQLKHKGYNIKYKLSADYALMCEIISKYPHQIFQLNRVICKYQLGGLSYIHRVHALREDFEIRKSIVKLPIVINYGLYFLHFTHYFLKKNFWWFYTKLRY